MKKIAALMTVSFVAALALAGCNTMEGAGQDVQRAGQKLEKSADQKK
jgi:entericidin A